MRENNMLTYLGAHAYSLTYKAGAYISIELGCLKGIDRLCENNKNYQHPIRAIWNN